MPLKKSYQPGPAGTVGQLDLSLTGGRLATDDGLETAILNSLFTHRQARPDDTLPPGQTHRRGWWGNPQLGSRLWLLEGCKQTAETATRARQYVQEALTWVEAQGIGQLAVETQWVKPGTLGIRITLTRTGRPDQLYDYLWENRPLAAVTP